ncbi:MAG: hypothetical protein J5850_03850 [Clostridia bacterium]|nr:hypothetical protein [Clostridia bacterium]
MKTTDKNVRDAWEDFDRALEFRRLNGDLARISENERFYLGDQWYDVDCQPNLPRPVFNLVRRLADYIVSTVLGYDINMKLAIADAGNDTKNLRALAAKVGEYAASDDFSSVVRNALRDAVLSGDGFIYARYDFAPDGKGKICASVIDSRDIFPSDFGNPDIQSQDQILIRGTASVGALRAEARFFGLPESRVALIGPDDESTAVLRFEPVDPEMATVNYLVRFYRAEDGNIAVEKSVRNCIIRSFVTKSDRYPISRFSFMPVRGSFYGNTPLSEIIGNQRYVNKAFALEMKHMNDTAFSKVIYDKRLIPEWNSDVGQAIGVMSGGDVSGAVTTVGVGEMQDYYIDVIDRVISYTKEMIGATDTALGDVDPTNTSAIMALREIAEVPLENLRAGLYKAIGDTLINLASIVASTSLSGVGQGVVSALVPEVSTGSTRKYMPSVTVNTLNQLLSGGHITVSEYLERLPDGIIPDRNKLINAHRGESKVKEESNDKR